MNVNRLRPYTAITMALVFVLLLLTGLLLFLAPHGPGTGNWVWMGLTKHQYKDIHLYLGFFGIGLAIFHGALNAKPLITYIQNQKGDWGHPLIWAVGCVAILVVLALSV